MVDFVHTIFYLPSKSLCMFRFLKRTGIGMRAKKMRKGKWRGHHLRSFFSFKYPCSQKPKKKKKNKTQWKRLLCRQRNFMVLWYFVLSRLGELSGKRTGKSNLFLQRINTLTNMPGANNLAYLSFTVEILFLFLLQFV